jgi:hypothetical protein
MTKLGNKCPQTTPMEADAINPHPTAARRNQATPDDQHSTKKHDTSFAHKIECGGRICSVWFLPKEPILFIISESTSLNWVVKWAPESDRVGRLKITCSNMPAPGI